MTDIERVRGFGKTLKAFQVVADQLNDIADLQATEKEAKRLTGDARSEFHSAMDELIAVKDQLQEAISLTEDAYKERDAIDKSSKENANHILYGAKIKAKDMVQNAHEAVDQIRHTHETEIANLQKKKIKLNIDLESIQNQLQTVRAELTVLREKLG